jgi:hypothetical protein
LIYCVVPAELADELFDKLTAYYADDENVTVIVDRRRGDRRGRAVAMSETGAERASNGAAHVRTVRDRRRRAAVDRLPLPRIDGSV